MNVTDSAATPFPQSRTCPYHPPAAYPELAAHGPLARVRLYGGREVWAVTGHAEARALLADARISADRRNPAFPVVVPRAERQGEFELPLLGVDDPRHAQQRRMLIPAFGLKRIAAMRPWIQRTVDGLLDAMLAAGPGAELVSAYALPVPSMAICYLLGVPYADHGFFETVSRELIGAQGADEAVAARDKLTGYFRGLIEEKERGAGGPGGLLDELVATPLAEGRLDREELVMMALFLLVAGHETTSNMISLGTFTLLEHPEQLAALRADPGLLPGAVEELLRLLAIADGIVRVAREDIEFHGVTIRAGDGVVFPASVVNRDAAVYADPDALDIRRSARHHVSFGFGVHQCLGQNLARAELEIALSTLFARIPTLRLAVAPDEVPVKPAGTLQGLYALPVTW
ncbi:cytochrome P450 [Streptomyces sp. UNOB3_S3]|uniref:cytochrome P450 n=1 Tax=Streptomyces sp. UNOB3_S3 TaxID=2871682 RepID=UPI001E63114C|nr:cytochrome P450 [Streptomyces sp. UNOB3_S3]MCC3773911.1 cytochrome P450 [Streptomyces sp. UNOB3_S3]